MANYKIVDGDQLDADLTSVADTIRSKSGTSDELEFPSGFMLAVESIESDLAVDSELSTSSENPVQNKVISASLNQLRRDLNDIDNAIGYISPYLVENSEFINGVWANGVWRTDGNYGKYKSNKIGFELESFTTKVQTSDYTNLVISITCFDENKASLGAFITNKTAIKSGSYSVTKTDILNASPAAKYISVAIGKLSGSTFYDLPYDIVITVEKTTTPQTIADRVSVLEAVMGSGTSVVVAQNGGGDYTTILDAVSGITDDSASKPYTIFIKNGVYDEHIHVGGDRYLSFIGENRENCIIRSHTGMYSDAPLWIDGNFTIENLTLQMLDDEAPDTWTPGISQSDPTSMMPGYALHIDGDSSTSINSVYGYKLGVVRNCTLYSVAFPAIGAGLHANQKLILEDCDFIRETSEKYNSSQYQYGANFTGAMVIHDTTQSTTVNQNLDIIRCRFLCNLSKSATFRFKYGTTSDVKYAMIDNTFWCEETATPDVDAELNDSVLLGYSHGNNNSMFNA